MYSNRAAALTKLLACPAGNRAVPALGVRFSLADRTGGTEGTSVDPRVLWERRGETNERRKAFCEHDVFQKLSMLWVRGVGLSFWCDGLPRQALPKFFKG